MTLMTGCPDEAQKNKERGKWEGRTGGKAVCKIKCIEKIWSHVGLRGG